MNGAILAALVGLGATAAQAATVTTTDVTTVISSQPQPAGILTQELREITTLTEGITEVLLSGVGLFGYADLLSGPDPTDTATAISDALGFFGLPLSTGIAGSVLSALAPTTSSSSEINLSELHGSIFTGDVSDPQDFEVTFGEVTITTIVLTTTDQPYRLDVTLADPGTGPDPPVVPLPACGVLLLTGLLGLAGAARLRRRG
jgi:hypothetical protein